MEQEAVPAGDPSEYVELERDERSFLIIGTAHVSRASAELVARKISEFQPDVVCLELCESRYQSLRDPDRWQKTDLFEVVRSGRTYLLATQLALASFQRRLARDFGIKPGEEMHRAIAAADERGIRIALVDREIKTSLKRAWGKASLWAITKLVFSLLLSGDKQITEKELEVIKKGDALAALLAEFGSALPSVKVVLIDERDRYMAKKDSVRRRPADPCRGRRWACTRRDCFIRRRHRPHPA